MTFWRTSAIATWAFMLGAMLATHGMTMKQAATDMAAELEQQVYGDED